MAGTPEQHIWILRNQLTTTRATIADEERKNGELTKENDLLKTLIGKLKTDVTKLTVHAKNCEKATGKAQKEAKHAKGNADHLINSQKGQLKNAERRYEAAARDLKLWTDKYGLSVNQPAEEKHALQLSVSEWQSKTEKARNEIASLEAQIEGTPEQIGLHQALEEWEEHQGCSAGFADFEDKLHDGKLRQQKLESDLTASRQHHQKTKSDLQALQVKAEQLEQANMAMQNGNNVYEYVQRIQQLESDLQTSIEQGQKIELDMKALEETAIQLERANKTFHDQAKTFHDQAKTDVVMFDDDMLEKQKLESNLRAFQERHQETESSMKILQGKADQLERANKSLQDQDELRKDMLHKLESDLEASKVQCVETDSNMRALQDKADQLEVDLRTTIEQHQTTKSNTEALQEKAEQLEVDLRNTKEQYQTTKSNMTAVQGEADRLRLDLKTTKEQYQTSVSDMEALQGKVDQLESDLEATREQYQTTKSNMEALQGKADQLEQANKSLQKEHERLQAKAFEKREQDDKANNETADAVQRDEERMSLMDQENNSKKLEQDSKAQHLRTETPMEAERSQVSSSAYTMGSSPVSSYPAQIPYSY